VSTNRTPRQRRSFLNGSGARRRRPTITDKSTPRAISGRNTSGLGSEIAEDAEVIAAMIRRPRSNGSPRPPLDPPAAVRPNCGIGCDPPSFRSFSPYSALHCPVIAVRRQRVGIETKDSSFVSSGPAGGLLPPPDMLSGEARRANCRLRPGVTRMRCLDLRPASVPPPREGPPPAPSQRLPEAGLDSRSRQRSPTIVRRSPGPTPSSPASGACAGSALRRRGGMMRACAS
jgi:hypothetical protein